MGYDRYNKKKINKNIKSLVSFCKREPTGTIKIKVNIYKQINKLISYAVI